ncbi:hypothetical protein D3C85_1756430 [compost metagenome]
MLLVLNGLLGSRQTRAPCFHLQQAAAGTFSTQIKRLEAAAFRNLADDYCTGAVTEQYTGIAVGIIRNA